MNNDQIKVIDEDGIYYVATESERVQVSDEFAAKLAHKNQTEICGLLRREPEITPDKLEIIERWCNNLRR